MKNLQQEKANRETEQTYVKQENINLRNQLSDLKRQYVGLQNEAATHQTQLEQAKRSSQFVDLEAQKALGLTNVLNQKTLENDRLRKELGERVSALRQFEEQAKQRER